MIRGHATEEDFYIILRYSENLAHGLGFVYNPGERVLGVTTPLYTLLLALLMRLHLDGVLCAKLLGLSADVASCIAVYRIGVAIRRSGAGLAAAVCIAFFPTNLIWATKGMEVCIVAAVAAWTWAAWVERREALAWGLAALLVLLRIDGLALVLVLFAGALWRDRTVPWRGLIFFILLLAPWLIFSTLYFGSPAPLSLQAKLIVYGYAVHRPFPHLGQFLTIMTHRVNLIPALGAVGYLIGMAASLRSRRLPPEGLLLPAAAWLLVYYNGMALSNVFLFGWYFVPPTPIYYLVAMTGWSLALDHVSTLLPPRFFKAVAALPTAPTVFVACLLLCVSAAPVLRDLVRTQEVEDGMRIPIGLWLRAHAQPTDAVMLEPIGYIGYYSRLRVLDTVGLVSPEVLPLWRKPRVSPRHDMWSRFQPQWVLLRSGEWDGLQKDEASLPPEQRFPAAYRPVRNWSDPAAPGAGPSFLLFRHR